MKEKEKLVEKWLNYELTETESESFKNLDDFAVFETIDRLAQRFKAPSFNEDTHYQSITTTLNDGPIIKTMWSKYIRNIAAVGIVALGLFYFLNTNTTASYYAEAGVQKTLSLPDTSSVTLNAESNISYNNEVWDRTIVLTGEAYFKVAKGKTFTVTTSQGSVEVLGTQFIVKDRPNIFEVVCYEGLVAVRYNNESYQLPLGTSLRIQNGVVIKEATEADTPSWINDYSVFKSSNLLFVLNELERQYNIKLITKGLDTSILFTGSFTHKNLDTALQSITIPLNLTYLKNGNTVTILKN